MKVFKIPGIYKSGFITSIKKERQEKDRLKRDFMPSVLDFGKVRINLARHFGFCYGVENAIEIAYTAIEENPGKRIFLLSEIIHNSHVNAALHENGVRFIMDTSGNQLIPWDEIIEEDVIIIPAFGTTIEMEAILKNKGIKQIYYKSKCPFVEKVWTRVSQIASNDYTVIVHGKPDHEETRATFSHSKNVAPSVVIKDMEEAILLADFIMNRRQAADFTEVFKGRHSEGFDVGQDLTRIGVVNQTTLLASDTQEIADFLLQTIREKYSLNEGNVSDHFANMKDTLCYATNDNQSAVITMLSTEADLAIVVGGYNSSNTSHLVELCDVKLPTYFISSAQSMISGTEIQHWDIHARQLKTTFSYLPAKDPVVIHLTSGASCPDILIENIILKLLSFYNLPLDALQAARAIHDN
ncbi:4-hydroxy-3-methylbut-2-enyl diphosphate reductase [Pedobacter cryoconitis]|uniref:4-hydroxy-3-methylbut-2-enyl diphosphate reductase n=1 Tax=Pedobacter cryoconitis TaxID=188932 RepID=A0A7X0J503_9SPHI|nr:4-hydroxy-3-methylbut-2-enyl diphosphate reductase [Pedobacter cryoconitis]MBB6501254.1 4-hydroxy-3-methylbut-2-enyl diphosphate reductase [Pedobacter cryoconitis]